MVDVGTDDELAKNQHETANAVKEFSFAISDFQSKTNFYIGNIIRANHEVAVKATVLEMLRDGQYMDDT